MNRYLNGIVSGFIATVVLSVLMLIKAGLGIMPEFNIIKDMTVLIGTTSPIAGWVIHFILGAFIWGLLFAIFVNVFKGAYWIRGIQFSVVLWLLMMVIFMPFVGNGFFASALGGSVVLATFVLHIIFGFVLGIFFGVFHKRA